MSKSPDLKDQRDRFLAFSFASADMLLEVDGDDNILAAIGASKNMTGFNEADIKGNHWLSLFEFKSRGYLTELKSAIKAGQRLGPVFVEMQGTEKKALLSAIKMPQNDTLYVSIGLANDLSDLIQSATAGGDTSKVLLKEDFIDSMEEKITAANKLGTETNLTFFDLDIDNAYRERLGDEGMANLIQQVGQSLSAESVGGDSAGQVSESRYSLLHETAISPEIIQEKIKAIAACTDPIGEGLDIKQKTIDTGDENMNMKDMSRALLYTLNEFERNGTDIEAGSLNNSFESYMNANSEKTQELKNFIQSGNFEIHFQPIINLETRNLAHYEVLSRFTHGDTQEWMIFCEDVGLASEFDLAVAEKLTNYIHYKANTTRTKFAMNISGQSMGNPAFFSKLQSILAKYDSMAERISFEITESYHIDNIKGVSQSIDQLKESGYKIALDDFGAGAASFDYLRELDVNYVKIDGKYIKGICESQRDIAIVKSITTMCLDLGVDVVAEFVENEEQVKILRKLGIKYGQGYLFSKPRPAPDYINEKTA